MQKCWTNQDAVWGSDLWVQGSRWGSTSDESICSRKGWEVSDAACCQITLDTCFVLLYLSVLTVISFSGWTPISQFPILFFFSICASSQTDWFFDLSWLQVFECSISLNPSTTLYNIWFSLHSASSFSFRCLQCLATVGQKECHPGACKIPASEIPLLHLWETLLDLK